MDKIIRVVAIDDNEAVLRSVKTYFRSNENVKVVAVFNNGKEGLNYLLSNQNEYDLILIDILLSQIDGIKILEDLKYNKIEKKIIVLSSFKDDYSIRKIQTLNAGYYMLKPIDLSILESRMLGLFEQGREYKLNNISVEVEVSSLLHDLGIPSHVRGYSYIREGIMLLYKSTEEINFITKDIYPVIAEKYDTTSTRVERAIRHAIEISCMRGDIKLMEDLFGNSIDFDRSRPTNSEFLTTIADKFKLNKKELVG